MVGLGYEALAEKLADRVDAQAGATVFNVAQDRTVRISWKQEVRAELGELDAEVGRQQAGVAGASVLDGRIGEPDGHAFLSSA